MLAAGIFYYWPHDSALERRTNAELGKRDFFHPHAVEFAIEWQCPDLESSRLAHIEPNDEEFEQFNETFRDNLEALYPDTPKHHLLGYANSVQDDVPLCIYLETSGEKSRHKETDYAFINRINNEVSQWRLLFQLDSQPALEKRRWEWIWGDAGMIYFCIRNEDLQQRRFDNVWLELQCY